MTAIAAMEAVLAALGVVAAVVAVGAVITAVAARLETATIAELPMQQRRRKTKERSRG
jgi:hypothetical protein